MYKRLMVSGILLLVIIMVLVGCSSTASPTASAPPKSTITATPSPLSATKPIELAVATFEPVTGTSGVILKNWIDKLVESTQGRVKPTLYANEALGKQAEEWDNLKTGTCDVAFLLPMSNKGVFPLCDVFSLPYVSPEGRSLSVMNQIFSKYLAREWSQVKVLWPDFQGNVQIHTSKKAVRTLEDIKGMQLRCPQGMQADSIKALGAVPVMVPAPEVYTALEKGMVEGCTFPFQALPGYKIQEVTKYHTAVSMFVGMSVVAMNQAKWNSLPPDIQKIIDETSPWAQDMGNKFFNETDNGSIALVKKLNHEIIYLTPEEKAKWVKLIDPVVTSWASNLDAKGLPATELVKACRAFSTK